MKRSFFIKKICYTKFVYERLRHQYNLGILYVGFIGKDGISETILFYSLQILLRIFHGNESENCAFICTIQELYLDK